MSGISDYRRNLAFKAGRTAYERGKPKTSCNRQRGTIYFDDWHDGYSEAFHADPKNPWDSAA